MMMENFLDRVSEGGMVRLNNSLMARIRIFVQSDTSCDNNGCVSSGSSMMDTVEVTDDDDVDVRFLDAETGEVVSDGVHTGADIFRDNLMELLTDLRLAMDDAVFSNGLFLLFLRVMMDFFIGLGNASNNLYLKNNYQKEIYKQIVTSKLYQPKPLQTPQKHPEPNSVLRHPCPPSPSYNTCPTVQHLHPSPNSLYTLHHPYTFPHTQAHTPYPRF